MIYIITRFISYLIFKIFFSFEVKGTENIPKDGAVIIASNHASYLDPIAVGATCTRKINSMAKEELFRNKFFGWYLKKLNIFPVKRHATDRGAVKEAIRKLKNGTGLLIFPEGTRSPDGNIKEAKTGISVLSYLAGASVVPCYVSGSYEIWPSHKNYLSRGRMSIFYGKPIAPLIIKDKEKKSAYRKFAQDVMAGIKRLKEENAS